MYMRNNIIWILSFLTFVIYGQQQIDRTLLYDGNDREYILYIPANYQESQTAPLLFHLHGGNGYAQEWISASNMRSIADTAGCILVYPQALADPNDEGSLNWIHKDPTDHDDIYFIESIIDELSSEYMIDESRIYACGYSLGGEFTFELLCRLNNRIAAGAAVARTMQTYTYNNCSPEHPTALMTILGTDDYVSPYEGLSWNGELFYVSADDMHLYWAEFNNTELNPIVVDVPNTNISDGTTVQRKTWANGTNCVSVEELKVNGGGHDWPGVFGNMDIDSDQEIWNFVSKHNINGLIDCNTNSSIEEIEKDRLCVKTINVLGQVSKKHSRNIVFHIYSDGSVEKQNLLKSIY